MGLKLGIICQVIILTFALRTGSGLDFDYFDDQDLQISITLCHPHQNFICVNQTHYKRCIILNHLKISNVKFLTTTFYCGLYHCCQTIGKWPCTDNCTSDKDTILNRENQEMSNRRVKKASNSLSYAEPIEDFNNILFIRTIITRQKDIQLPDTENKKPSYREACPLNLPKLRISTIAIPNQIDANFPKPILISEIVSPKNVIYRAAFQGKKPNVLCSIKNLNEKLKAIGSCTNYFVCLRNALGNFQWRLSQCPAGTVFLNRSQRCVNSTLVSCKLD